MDKKDKHTKTKDKELIQYYLEELSNVKLLDRHTLRKVHTNLKDNAYFDSDVFDSITKNIIDEKTIN